MNTKSLIEAFLAALLAKEDKQALGIFPLIIEQIEKEFPTDAFGPVIPEEIFMLFNTPELRGLVVLSFFRCLDIILQ